MANKVIQLSSGSDNFVTKRIGEQHEFIASWSAGTIGTRAAQQTYTPSAIPTSVQVTYIGTSSKYIPLVFISGNTVYCNYYRADASAASTGDGTVRVMIYFD